MRCWLPALLLLSVGSEHCSYAISLDWVSIPFSKKSGCNQIDCVLRRGHHEKENPSGKAPSKEILNDSGLHRHEFLNENPSIADIHLSRKAFHLVGGFYFAVLRNSLMSKDSFVTTFLAYE
jgi:hypothetical protein